MDLQKSKGLDLASIVTQAKCESSDKPTHLFPQ